MTVCPCGAALDVLRSCYSTTMEIAGVGPVKVRWYFTDEPFLQTPNVYNSRNWLTDKSKVFPFGEIIGAARPYYNGRPPIALFCPGPFGDANAWEGKGKLPFTTCPGIGEFKAAELDQERSWILAASFTPKFRAAMHQERSWSAAERASASYATSWNQERSWSAAERASASYATSWNQERSWSAAERSSSHNAIFWNQERSWSISSTWSPTFDLSWFLERLWSVSSSTHNNLTSFTQGTTVATGSNQGTAATISNDLTQITSTASGQGVILPSGPYLALIGNANSPGPSATINVYPPSGGQIGTLGTNNPQTITAGQAMLFIAQTTTLYRQIVLN